MTDKEIQASDEEMERFNVSQNEKCVLVKTEKLNDLMNKISFALKDATLAQGFEIICNRISELEKENEELKKICDFNCPVHKLATHNACLTCPAVRNSPHHDLKNVSDEELQKIIKDAEAEMEM